MNFSIFYYISFCSIFCFSNLETNQPVFTLKRTACYGKCPQYELRLYANGLINYEGKMFVDKIGCFQFSISKKKIDQLFNLINEVNYFSFDDVYDAEVSDVPSIITEVNYQNKSHQIIDRFKGPKELEKLYKLIDSYIETNDQWLVCDT